MNRVLHSRLTMLAAIAMAANAANASPGHAQSAAGPGVTRNADTTALAGATSQRRFLPKSSEWLRAGEQAIFDRGTVIPTLAAVAIVVGGWDAKISRWAITHTVVNSSSLRAARNSDDYRLVTQVLMVGSALLAKDSGKPLLDRVDRLAWEHVGFGTTYLVTTAGKAAFRRLRPDESNRRSLPSGHASMAAYATAVAMRNFSDVEMSRALHVGADIASGTLAAATAWSRVEAGVHYPTDVLVGAALGNAFGVFFYELYDGRKEPPVAIRSGTAGGIEVSMRIRF